MVHFMNFLGDSNLFASLIVAILFLSIQNVLKLIVKNVYIKFKLQYLLTKIGMKTLYNDNLYILIPILNNTTTSSNNISDSIENTISNFIVLEILKIKFIILE